MDRSESNAFKAEKSPDTTQLRLAISATLTAIELERLIHRLAEIRAQMAPEVSRSIAEQLAFDGPAATEAISTVTGGLTGDGRLMLWMRSSGFGLLRCTWEKHQADDLRALLNGRIEIPGAPH